MENPDYLQINKNSWNNRLEAHLASDFYDMDNFKSGRCSLNQIELDLLGIVKGKSLLHLQCHFGQDTISLARKGAQVVGIDLSDQSIKTAKNLSLELNVPARFMESDVYNLPNALDEKFDIVFTSYGTISWLPDLDKWAQVIWHFLKPRGLFVFVEFHPVVWMFDDDFNKPTYDYFNTKPIIETEEGTYANREAAINQKYICWNHSMAEVFKSLKNAGLNIVDFKEYDYAPYPFIDNMKKLEEKKYIQEKYDVKIPLVYSMVAHKN